MDSILAIKIIQSQNIEIIALHVNIGFNNTKTDYLKNICKQINVNFIELDIQNQFVQEILFSPKYGYGKNFNPCIDCHANMFKIAKKMMKKLDAQFLISGEVIGQRPMSQNSTAINSVIKLSEIGNILLRPLSAKLLPPTIPELEKWVNREKLFGISGRNRTTQFEIAKKFNLENFENPAGGCLLTEPYFAKKIRDFIKYEKIFNSDDINVLKYGRHFRLQDTAKLVIGRNHDENIEIEKIENNKFQHIKLIDLKGPVSLLSKNASEIDINFALKSVLTYTKANKNQEYKILFHNKEFIITPFENKEIIQKFLI